MSDLLEIGKKYPTSKNISGFLEIYEIFFKKLRDKEINILEIGVDKGDSLRLWREYFSKANICGVDIIKKEFIIEDVEIFCGDQTNYRFLDNIIKKYIKFDIIIDDGSHKSKDIINTFAYLFKHLNQNGLYIIEDLQTSYIPRYGGNRFDLNKKNTSMNFIKSLSDSINYEHKDKPFFKRNDFNGMIKSVHFYQNISIIEKGQSVKYYYKDSKETTFADKIKKLISLIYK